jgi:DUF1016 N-terminal domain
MTVRAPKQGGDGYASLLAELKERIRTARLKAAVAVNEELILLYWSIGRDILDRQTTAGWVRASLIVLPPINAATFRR